MVFRIKQLPRNTFFEYKQDKPFPLDFYCCVWWDYVRSITTENNKSFEEILEILFREFNINLPDHFAGHSMSVSDIVEFIDEETYNTLAVYRCEDIGWSRIK